MTDRQHFEQRGGVAVQPPPSSVAVGRERVVGAEYRPRPLGASTFWRTVVAGLVATFVMTMTGFYQAGVGLPASDVGAMLTQTLNRAHEGTLYTPVAGNLAHFANGVLLALIWVAFLRHVIPGNWLVQGLVYSVILYLAAVLVVVPLAAEAGVFFSRTPMPMAMSIASLVIHVAYGVALTLTLYLAGIQRDEVRPAA
ncbi:MAG: hypothetical protein M9894_20555 [Planctomycetes bacterium]|nr:hypothetical protein [Planctomycetota bacterium]